MNEALIILDKNDGPTSFDMVREVKRLVPGAKVGHAGSLDPFATGVLVLLLGKATKLSGALLNADKRYRATMKLGSATDTMDLTGSVTETKPLPDLSPEVVEATLQSFTGVWEQTAPMYSAKKIHGVRFYELARQNIKVRRAPIPVNLHEIKMLKCSPEEVEFEVHCSKGTYIRSLADEMGKRLGTVAHLTALRRLSCGNFTLDQSVTLEELKKDVPRYIREGHGHYTQLLRSEGVIQRGQPSRLQMGVSSGNSLLN